MDVNVLVALLDEDHVHHSIASQWFSTPGLQWAICPFSEAGLLRHMTRPKIGDLTMQEATEMLARLAEQPGYHYQAISAGWQALCGRLFQRISGHKQVTDAYLLGLALHEGLILVTFDRAILHLAGEDANRVLLLAADL